MEPTYVLLKTILKPWLGAWFRWTIEGLHNIPRRGPAILAFNHISYFDSFAAAYVVDRAKRRPRFLAKSELFEDKRIAWLLKGARQIEVRRGNAHAPMALDHAVSALEKGDVVVVFPEGTITTDPDLRPLPPRTGTARLALQSRAPLIPCALWGTQNIWPKGYGKRWRPRQHVAVRIGNPLTVHGDPGSRDAWDEIGKQVMEAIAELVASLKPAVPDRRRPAKRRAA